MDTNTEQRLKRLEEKVFEKEEDFVVIDIPGARLRMKKYQERDEEDMRITNLSYEDAIERLREIGSRLMTINELRAMRNYTIKKSPSEWMKVGVAEKLLGCRELNKSELVYDCDEVVGFRWNGAPSGPFCAILNNDPSYVYYSIGFRCCRDLESDDEE